VVTVTAADAEYLAMFDELDGVTNSRKRSMNHALFV
jgi:hypothetical protein